MTRVDLCSGVQPWRDEPAPRAEQKAGWGLRPAERLAAGNSGGWVCRAAQTPRECPQSVPVCVRASSDERRGESLASSSVQCPAGASEGCCERCDWHSSAQTAAESG